MSPQLGPRGCELSGGLRNRRDRLHGVPVLARVERQLLAAQLSGRPAPIEGVAEHVPALAALLDPLPDPLRQEILLSSAGESQENSGAVRPQASDIAVPPFPPGTEWIGSEPGAVERICARGPLLVHFVDAAHLSSVRTLPYVGAWQDRYRDLGLTLVGVNSPRFPFTADPGKLAAALSRLGVGFPVAADSRYRIWHDYGCEGWPSLFLWGRGGALRWFHFGEGEYAATESAIQEELRALDPDLELADPLPALRPATPSAPSSRRPPTRSSRAARSPSRGKRAKAIRRWSWTTLRAAPGRRSTGTACCGPRSMVGASWRSRSRRRAPTSWPPTTATKRTTCLSAPRPAFASTRSASRRGCPREPRGQNRVHGRHGRWSVVSRERPAPP